MRTNYFEECQHCVPPKRYPGCHGTCPDYKKARTKYDEDAAKIALEKKVQGYSNRLICNKRDVDAKHRKSNRRYNKRDRFY